MEYEKFAPKMDEVNELGAAFQAQTASPVKRSKAFQFCLNFVSPTSSTLKVQIDENGSRSVAY